MEKNPGASGSGEGPTSSSSTPGTSGTPDLSQLPPQQPLPPAAARQPPSRYESQKRRDWSAFLQYLKNHKPPLSLARCSGAHVIEFLKYLDQFGKTKVHNDGCSFFGHPNPPSPCACPLKQAWGSLDALIGRLRAAYEENGGMPESNPFGARAVRIYLREVRESQAKARGIPYEKKKRKRTTAAGSSSSSSAQAAEGGEGAGDVDGADASTTATVAATPTVAGASVGGTGGSGASAGDGSGAPQAPGGSSSACS